MSHKISLENGKIHKISLQVFTKLLGELDYELEIVPRKPFYYFDVGGI